MPVEILKEPEVLLENDTLHHVLAIDNRIENGEKKTYVAGEVAVVATTHKRYLEDRPSPATLIVGLIGEEGYIYEKLVGNTGPFTSLVYGLRIGIARRKAPRHVKSALK